MTAIAAVFRADGREDAGSVRRMLDAAAHRAELPSIAWTSGGCTLGYRASIRRDGLARASFAATPDGNAIVFDGRLDNCDDLQRALSVGSGIDAAALVLAAFAKWSDETAPLLLGDFAFALWDAQKRRLFCVRDVFGQRPLMYASMDGLTAVGSEPQQLLAHPAVPSVVNEGAIAERLAGTPTSIEETVWTRVMRLPPAHALTISETGVRKFRYWDFDPDARLEYPRGEEYAAHFMDLFRAAIDCRTRGASAVGVFLSGGLDSSSIAAAAQSLARARGRAAVHAFSLAFSDPSTDERPYIDAVVEHCGLRSIRLAARAASRTDIESDIARWRDVPAHPNGSVFDPLRRRAASDVDVVLTGYGGDDWFTGSPLHTADLLREGRFGAAARQYRHDVALPGRGYTRIGLLRAAVSPVLPRAVRAVLRPFVGTRPRTWEWIRPEFAGRVALSDRLQPALPAACRTFVQTQIRRMITALPQTLADEFEDRAAAAAGLEQRHPFNDRRLAEFGFALPESQRWAGGETKVVMRKALGSMLPAAVRQRNDKAEFTSTFMDAFETLGGREFFSHLRSAEVGWIDAAVVRRMYDSMAGLYRRRDEAYIPLANAIWSVAAVELWLKDQQKERYP